MNEINPEKHNADGQSAKNMKRLLSFKYSVHILNAKYPLHTLDIPICP